MGRTINTLLLDLDGTLVDSGVAHFSAWEKVLLEIGVHLSSSLFEDVSGLDTISAAKVLLSHKPFIEPEVVARRKDAIFGEMIPSIRPFPGGRELVLSARDSGVRTGVVTSACERHLRELCADILRMSDLFDSMLSVESVGRPKPDPALLLQSLANLRGIPEYSIYVGDALVDILMAQRAGIPSIGISKAPDKQQSMIKAGATNVVIDLIHVARLLENWRYLPDT